MENYYNILETIVLIYAADEGKLKIYLKKKQDDPYKGYWILPCAPLDNQTTLEENAHKIYENMTNLNETVMFQNKIFSNLDRNPNNRIIGVSFVAITDKNLTDMKKEDNDKAWFDVEELPKLGFDHAEIIEKVSKEVKKQIVSNYNDMFLSFFPSDFTLPELQNFYENVLGKPIDRRNFHKKFVNQELVYDPTGHARLMDYFAKTKREMTENNLLQALTFKDGRGIANPNGLAVGIYYEDSDHTHYLLLPGPPRELKAMFRQNVVPLLREINPQDTKLYSRVLRFYGIGESQLVTLLADFIDHQTNPTIAPYAKTNEVTLRLTANAPSQDQADVLLDELEEKIQALAGAYFYGYGDDFSLAEAMITQLKEKKRTISVAESLTAGLFASTLGQYPGVSQVFKGGVVTYSLA